MRTVAWLVLLGAAACGGSAVPANAPAEPLPASAPVATAVAPAAETARPREEAAREPAPAPEPESDGPSAGLRLHRRDTSGLRPGDLIAGSGGPPAPVPGPSVEVGPVTGVSNLDNAARVIARLRPGFRRCYDRALKADPAMSGVLALEAKLGARGEVESVSAKGAKGVAADLVACLAAVARRAQFAPPEGGAATLSVPFSITRQ